MRNHNLFHRSQWMTKSVPTFLRWALIAVFVLNFLPATNADRAMAVPQLEETTNVASPNQDQDVLLPLVVNGNSSSDTRENDPEQGVLASTVQLNYLAGQTYAYAWVLTLGVESHSQDGDDAFSNGTETRIEGTVDLEYLSAAAGDRFNGRLSIRDVTLVHQDEHGELIREENDELLEMVGTPLRFTQAADGEILSVSYPESVSPEVTNIQKGIVSSLQLRLRSGSSYTVEEQGVQGKYVAHYEVNGDVNGNGNTVQITKNVSQDDFSTLVHSGDEVDSLNLTQRVEAEIDSVEGVITFVRTTESILSMPPAEEWDADGTDSSTEQEGFDAWTGITSVVTLTLLSVTEAPDEPEVLLPYTQDTLFANLAEEADELSNLASPDDEAIGSVLDALEANPADLAAFGNALDLLEQYPSAVNEINARLQAPLHDEIVFAYIDLLGASGTDRAQQILVDTILTADAHSLAAKESTLISLAILETPTATSVEAIQTLSTTESDLQEQAVLSLGAVGSAMANAAPEEIEELAALFHQQLAEVETLDDAELYLGAIGNLGHTSSVAYVEPYLEIDHAQTRGVAVEALGGIESPHAATLLIDRLQHDEDPEVQMMAALALESQQSEPNEEAPAVLALSDDEADLGVLAEKKQTWNQRISKSTFGISFPGEARASDKPSIYVEQSIIADGKIRRNGQTLWSFDEQLAKAKAFASRQHDKAWAELYIRDKKIKRVAIDLGCSKMVDKTLLNKSQRLLKKKAIIPVNAGITFEIEIAATANFGLQWEHEHNWCQLPQFEAKTIVVPHGHLNLQVVGKAKVIRGFVQVADAKLNANVMKGHIAGAAVVKTINQKIPFCLNVKAEIQPVDAKLELSVGTWRLRKTWTPWQYQSAPWEKTFVDKCLVVGSYNLPHENPSPTQPPPPPPVPTPPPAPPAPQPQPPANPYPKLGATVDHLYQTFFGRAADAGGRAQHIKYIADRGCSPTAIGNVIKAFAHSAEFNNRIPEHVSGNKGTRLKILFRTALLREADGQGWGFWAPKYGNSQWSWSQLVGAFVSTSSQYGAEFRAKAPGMCR